MGKIQISAFNPANDRRTVMCGEEFEVDLTVLATPLTDGATDEVQFTSSVGGCTITPAKMTVTVEPMENRVTKHFRMSLHFGTKEELTEITVRTVNSGSADSFVIRVVSDRS